MLQGEMKAREWSKWNVFLCPFMPLQVNLAQYFEDQNTLIMANGQLSVSDSKYTAENASTIRPKLIGISSFSFQVQDYTLPTFSATSYGNRGT